MVSIGSLEISIKADMSDYNRARKTLEQDQGLKFHIVPTVDHKNLVALNQHFSEKEDHHKKVQKGFNQNPLTPKVDLRELNSLTKAYQDLSRLKGNLTSGSGTIHFAVEHTYKVDIRESNRDIAHQIKDLGSGLRDIVAAVKSTKQGIVGKAVGGLIGTVASTPLAIARGALEGVGRSISKDLGTGARQEIESAITAKFGSSKAIGQTIAKKAISGISDKLESLNDFIDSELENEIATRIKKKKKEPTKKEQILSNVQKARDFVSLASDVYVDQNLRTRESRINAYDNEKKERAEKSKANKGLYSQQGSSIRVGRAISALDSLDSSYESREDTLKATLAQINKQIADNGLVITKLESDLEKAVSKGDMKTAKTIKEKIDTKLAQEVKLSDKISGIVPIVNSLAAEKQKELKAILDNSSLSPKELEQVIKIRKSTPKIALVNKDIKTLESAISELEKKKAGIQERIGKLGENDVNIASLKEQIKLQTAQINELTTKSLSGKPNLIVAKQRKSIDKEISGLNVELDSVLKSLIKEYNKNRPEEMAILDEQKSRMKSLESIKSSFQKEVKTAHPDMGGSAEKVAAVLSKYQKEVSDFALSMGESLDPSLSVKDTFSVLRTGLSKSIKTIENKTVKTVADSSPEVKAIQDKIKAKHKQKFDLKPPTPTISKVEVDAIDQKIGQLQAEKNELMRTLKTALVDDETKTNLEMLANEADKQILAFEKTKQERIQKKEKLSLPRKQFEGQRKAISSEVGQQKIPAIIQQIMESVNGGKLPDVTTIPKIIVNEKALKDSGASALYDAALNQMIVTKELKKRIDTEQLLLKDTESLLHEGQHFVDFEGGSAEGLEARNQGRIRGKKVKAITPEIEKAARANVAQYDPSKRAYELNAVISAKNNASGIHEQYKKDVAQQKLYDVGQGGQQIIQALTSIKGLKETINGLLQEMDSVKLPKIKNELGEEVESEVYTKWVDGLASQIFGAQNVSEKIRETLKTLIEYETGTFADNASPEFVDKIIEKIETQFMGVHKLMKSFGEVNDYVNREMSLLDPFSSFADKANPFSKNIPTNKDYTHVPMAPDPFGTNQEYNNSDFKKWHTDKSLIEQYTKIGKQSSVNDPMFTKQIQELIKSQPTGFMPVKTNIFGQRTERVVHSIPDPFGDESPEEYINGFNQLGGSKDLAVRENKPSRNVTGHQEFTRKRVGILSDLSAQMDNLEYLKAVTVKEFEKIQKKSDPYANKLSKSDIEKQSTKLIASVNELQDINKEIALVGQKMKDRIATFNEHSGNVESIESMLDNASNLEDFALLQKAKRQIAENIKSVRKNTNMDDVTKSILTSQYKDLAGKAKIDSKFVAMPSIKEIASLPMQSIETFTDMAREGLATVQNKASEFGTEFVETVTYALTTALHESQLLIQQAKSNPIGLLKDAGKGGLALANKGARAIAPAAAGTYGIMRGAEKALFSLSEFKAFGVVVNLAEVVKAIMQTSAGVALMHSAPVVGELFQAVGGGVGHLAGGAVNSELAGRLIQETPKLAEGAGFLARGGHAISTQAINASNAAVTPVIEGVTQITTAATSAAVEFVTEIVALLTTGKITVDHAKKLLEAQTVDDLKALAPSVQETIKKTQIQVTDFGEKYREARKLIGEGTGYNKRLGDNIGSVVHLLPESQQSIALKAAPILSDVEKAYSGDLDYQKEYNIPGLKGMGTKQFEKLPKFVQKAVKEQIVMMFNSVEQAKREVEANLSGLVGDEKKGILSDINTGLGAKLKALQTKGKQFGIGEERLKIEKLSDLPSVDVSSSPVINLKAPEIQSMPDLSKLARHNVEGAAEAFEDAIPVYVEAISKMSEAGHDKFIEVEKIQSPSKVWKALAKWLGLGTILGIKESIPDVKKATEEMAKAAITKKPDGFLPLPKLPPEFTQKVKEAEERKLHFEGVQLSDQYKPTGDKNLDALLKRLRESSNKIDKAIADIAVNANAEMGTAIASGNQKTIDSNKELLKSIQETYNQVSVAQDKQDIDSGNLVRSSYKKLQKLVDLYALEPVGSLPDAKEVNALVQRLSEKAKKLDNATDIIDQVDELQQSGYSLKDAKRIAQNQDPNAPLGIKDDLSRIGGNLFGKLRTQFPIIDQGIEKLRTLKSTIVTLGAAGLGIIGLVLIGKQLSNIAIESVKVYRNFESIFIASKMIKNGDQFLGDVRKQVQALGGDLETTMRQGQQFVTGLQGTALEGNASKLFFESDQALKAMGLQTQQYESAILAIKQVAGKGKVSMEEISGQLGEVVPGALNLAAQSMQTSVQGFIQMVEYGNLLSEDFVPKFVAKLKQQTAFLEPEVKKSLNTSLGRLSGSQTELQVSIGAAISPAVVPTINKINDLLILVNNNFDKVVIGGKLLTTALAFPVIKLGFQAVIQYSGMIAMSLVSAAKAANMTTLAMVGLKAVTTGVWAAGIFAATAAVDILFHQINNGTPEVKNANEILANSVDKVTDSYNEAIKAAKELQGLKSVVIPQNNSPESSNWFEQQLDKINRLSIRTFGRGKGEGTFGEKQQEIDKKGFAENIAKFNASDPERNQLRDAIERTKYLKDAIALDDEIKKRQGYTASLQMIDPAGNYEKIKKVQAEIAGLVQEKDILNNTFLPSGEGGIEQKIKALENYKETLVKLQKPLSEGGLGQNWGKEIDQINGLLKVQKIDLELIKEVNSQISSGVNDQRLAYIGLNAEIEQSNNLLQSKIASSKTQIYLDQAAGKIGTNTANSKLAQIDVNNQQQTVNNLLTLQKKREAYLKTSLDAYGTSTIENAIGKKITDFNAGDVKTLEQLTSGNSQLKQVVTEQILGVMSEYSGVKLEVLNALDALAQSKKAARENALQLTDSQRDLARSLEDWNLEMKRQAIDYTQQIESYRREVEDAGISASRENRDLAESFSDLMLDLQTQLKTAQNEFIDIQDRIKNTRLKRELLEISPGIDSYGKQIATIFANLREALSGNESEARSLEMKQEQIGREYVNTLRKIRGEQERQYDAERMRTRAIADLAIKTVQLAMNLQSIILNATRQTDDRNRQNNRENRGMPGFKENQFQTPNFQKANLSQQQAPVSSPITVQSNLLSNIQKSQGANIQVNPSIPQNNIVSTTPKHSIYSKTEQDARNQLGMNGLRVNGEYYDPLFHLPALNEELGITQPIQQQVSFAQPAPISVGFKFNMKPDELEMMKRLVLAEAGGEGIEGQAAVARAIFNRQTMINKHGISPGTYFAKSGSLQDIMTARSPKTGKAQFSPFDDGRINKPFTPAQLAQAEAAIAIAQDPNSLRNILQRAGLNPSQATKAVNATGFRNTGMAKDDPSQNHNTVQLRNHRLNGDQFSKDKLRAYADTGSPLSLNFGMPKEFENIADLNGMAVPKQPELMAGNWLTDRIKDTKNYLNRGRKNWTLENWKKEFDLLKKGKDWTLVMLRAWIKKQYIETGNVDIKVLQELNAMIVQQEQAEKKVYTRHRELLDKKNKQQNQLPPVRTNDFQKKQAPIKVNTIPVVTRPVVMPKVEEPRLENARLQKNNQLTPSSLFSGEMVSFRKRKIEDLLRLVAHIEGESESLITKGVVDALNAGKLGKPVKFEWLQLTQQQVENYIKLSDKDRDAYIKKILSKPKSKPRLTPVINEVLRLEAQQNKPQVTTTNAPVSTPKQSVQDQPVYQPINVREQLNYGIYPQVPSFEHGNASGLAEQLNAQQLLNNEAEKGLNIENRKLIVAQQIEEMARMQYTLIDANKSNERFVNNAIYSARDMLANAKGYLTVQEQIAKSVADVNGQYRSQLESLEDQKTSLQRIKTGWQEELGKAQNSLIDPDKILTEDQVKDISGYIKELQNNLNKIGDIGINGTQLGDIDRLIKSLKISNQIAVNATHILETENLRIESLTKIADLEANIATARYNQGGTLVNEASIIKARIDGIKMVRDAQKAYDIDNSLGSDYVTKTKELADINLSQSYVDAIPFLKDFSTGLKDVVLRTSTWQESLKKLFDLANSTVIDQFLIKPFQNMIAGVAKDWGLFGGEVPGMNAPKVASDLIQNNIVPTGQFGVGAVTQDHVVTDSLKTFNETLGNSSEVIPSAIQSITDGSITQGAAIALFTQGLIQATMALQSFALAAGGGVATGLGGIFGSLFNSGNASAGASLGGALSGGYSGIMKGILPFAKGGPIINRAEGGPVEIGMNAIAALQKEKALNGGQPTALIAATVGEYVLTKEQASDYLAEKENAHRWNNLQSQNTQVMNRAQGGSVGNVSAPVGRGGTVNNVGSTNITIQLDSRNDLGYSLGQIERRRQLDVDRSVKRFS